jgi:hypothetical protein
MYNAVSKADFCFAKLLFMQDEEQDDKHNATMQNFAQALGCFKN